MLSLNKVTLIGNLGRDPEMRYTSDGKPVCNLSVATTDGWNDRQSGEKRQKTEWHRIVLFDRKAEIAGQYLRKGSQVYIEGQLQTKKWQDKNGQDRTTTEIIGREMKFGDKTGGDGQRQDKYTSPQQTQSQPAYQAQPAQPPQPTNRPPVAYSENPQGGPPQDSYPQQYGDADLDDIPF